MVPPSPKPSLSVASGWNKQHGINYYHASLLSPSACNIYMHTLAWAPWNHQHPHAQGAAHLAHTTLHLSTRGEVTVMRPCPQAQGGSTDRWKHSDQKVGEKPARSWKGRGVLLNPVLFQCSGFRTQKGTGWLFLYVKLPSQTKKWTHRYLSIKPGHNCYVRLLFLLLFVSGDSRSYY